MSRPTAQDIFIPLAKSMFSLFLLLNLYPASATIGQELKPLKRIQLQVEGRFLVSEIFRMIEKKSELNFSYHKGDLDGSLDAYILISQKESSAYEVLSLISREEQLRFKRINNTINVIKDRTLQGSMLEEETFFIKGRITDEQEEGLPGATVRVKGTNIGAITDINGEFQLEVPEGTTVLLVTYVGFIPQEINLSRGMDEVNVILKPDLETLDEVVVVGYGQQKKESITGSIAKIEAKEIVQTKTANVANNLAGRVPGLVVNARGGEPGQESMEILIRGKATTGDASPLFVIDGVANRGSFERLNPDDIESISVLKDASAAIYGAQAANGVILVTTKRGAEGKPKFNYNNSFSITQPAKRQELMNASQYLTWVDEVRQREGSPQIFQNVIEDYNNGDNDPNIWADTDWWEEAADQWSPQYQHSLSISGGSKDFRYFVSGQHLYQDAIFKGSEFGFTQNNVRSNIDINATSFLEIGLDLAGRSENREGTGGTQEATEGLIRGIYNMTPWEAPYYENGLLRLTSRGNIIPNTVGLNGATNINRKVYNTKLTTKISLDQWVSGLSITGWGAIDIINQERRSLTKPYDIFFLNDDDVYENQREITGTINLFQQMDEEISQTYHARINYTRSIGDHQIGGFIAYEQNQLEGEYLAASRIDLVSEDLPFIFTGSEENQDNDGQGRQVARVNYFGRLNYSFADKYLVEFTLRYDGSQNFPTNNRFGTFPGVSIGWRISEEGFINAEWIDELKLRSSWGILGNDRVVDSNGDPALFDYLNLFNIDNGGVLGENGVLSTGLTPSVVANPMITWETANKTNIGVDMVILNGMLNFTADAFYEERSDILARRSASVPLYTGIDLPSENIGKTKNQGIELSVLHRRVVSKDFDYRIGGQFTYAKNEIIFVDESEFVPDYQRREGSQIDNLLVYQADGLYQTQEEIDNSVSFPGAAPGDIRIVDVNGDGVLDGDDRVLLPNGPTPRVVYGFNLGARWKGLELNAFFQGQSGASTIYRPWAAANTNIDAWYFENRWISADETPNALAPAPRQIGHYNYDQVSTIWVRDNNFLRIKNVELAYNFSDEIISKLKLSNLRVFVSGFNLGFIHNSVGLYDPESRSDTGWFYPQQRVVSTGLSVTF